MNLSLVRYAAAPLPQPRPGDGGHRPGRHDRADQGHRPLRRLPRGASSPPSPSPTSSARSSGSSATPRWAVHVPRRLQELRVELARAREELAAAGPSRAERRRPRRASATWARTRSSRAWSPATATTPPPWTRPVDAGGGQSDAALSPTSSATRTPPWHCRGLPCPQPLLAPSSTTATAASSNCASGRRMTQAEIGAELGLSQMHVSRLLSRACRTLREGLLAEG